MCAKDSEELGGVFRGAELGFFHHFFLLKFLPGHKFSFFFFIQHTNIHVIIEEVKEFIFCEL